MNLYLILQAWGTLLVAAATGLDVPISVQTVEGRLEFTTWDGLAVLDTGHVLTLQSGTRQWLEAWRSAPSC